MRYLDTANLFHPLLSLFLFFEQLALALDVAAIALGDDVLPHRLDGLARDDLVADRGLDRHLEELTRDPYLKARVALLEELSPDDPDPEFLALRDSLRKLFAAYVEKSPNIANEVAAVVADVEDAGFLSDFVARCDVVWRVVVARIDLARLHEAGYGTPAADDVIE